MICTTHRLTRSVPFISSVSLRTITIKSGPSGQTPSALHLVSHELIPINRPLTKQYKDGQGLDFSDVESREPTQKLECIEQQDGVEYQVK